MGEKLSNPPVIEAICEFRFDPSSPWDWTIPGRLFEKIQDRFPERSEVKRLGLQVQLDKGEVHKTQVDTGPERLQLKRTDGTALVQIGSHLLSVNHFSPYPGWEDFRELIFEIFFEYHEISERASLSRIGLRYINQMPLPQGNFRLDDFISLAPDLPSPLDRPLINFFHVELFLFTSSTSINASKSCAARSTSSRANHDQR